MSGNRNEMTLSVVIPTCGRVDTLRACIQALRDQSIDRERYEIVVVDNTPGGSPETLALLERIGLEKPDLRYLRQPKKGPAAARNMGLDSAKGRIIAFTDDDCIVSRDWVRGMVEAHRRHEGAAAVGGFTEVDPENPWALVSQFLSNNVITFEIDDQEEVIFFPTCNVSLKKELLDGESFDETFPFPAGEDLEFFWRLYRQGRRFVFDPKIRIFHNCNPTVRSFLRQAYLYGRGNYQVKEIYNNHPVLGFVCIDRTSAFLRSLGFQIVTLPLFAARYGYLIRESFNVKGPWHSGRIGLALTLEKIFYLKGNIDERYGR